MQKKIKPEDEKKPSVNKETQEWQSKYLRALADYQNLEKRTHDQIANQQKNAIRRLLLKFLDILDNLKRAEVFIKDDGLKLVMSDFMRILQEENITEMDLIGKPYDPHFAECIEVVEGKEENIIIEVVQPGYLINSDVLRIAQVKVTKK